MGVVSLRAFGWRGFFAGAFFDAAFFVAFFAGRLRGGVMLAVYGVAVVV